MSETYIRNHVTVRVDPDGKQTVTNLEEYRAKAQKNKGRIRPETDAACDIHILKAQEHAVSNHNAKINYDDSIFNAVDNETGESPDPLSALYALELDMQTAERHDDPDFLYPNLVVMGHITTIPGKSNSGKTTIFMREVCPEIVRRGYKVSYINLDIAGTDVKEQLRWAQEGGFTLLTPELQDSSAEKVMDIFQDLIDTSSAADMDLQGQVFVFDTLKKFVDLMSKKAVKAFMVMMRALNARGATIVLLAHTNKYDVNGVPVFEGVNDVRADSDEMIYFVHEKRGDGTIVVSTDYEEHGKVRSKIEPITFDITPERRVSRREQFFDVAEQQKRRAQYEKDEGVVEWITDILKDGPRTQTDIVAALADKRKVGDKTARNVLKRYADRDAYRHLWDCRNLLANNAKQYVLRT